MQPPRAAAKSGEDPRRHDAISVGPGLVAPPAAIAPSVRGSVSG